jgi:hypothetical protein
MHCGHQGLIIEEAINVPHPRFLEIADGFGKKRVPKMPLPIPRVSHPRDLRRSRGADAVRCHRWRNASRFNAAIAHPVSQKVAQAW